MDEKKNDFTVKVPEHELRSFNASPPQQPFMPTKPLGRATRSSPLANITNNPPISILAYCLASISMTVTNKYCVSGANWNLNFFYLAIQVSPPQSLPQDTYNTGTNTRAVSGLYRRYRHLQTTGHDHEPGPLRLCQGKNM